MMAAAAMGATAFQKGLGAIHSLSHPMSAFYDTHHGLANAVFMPYVVSYNHSVIDQELISISRHLNLKVEGYTGVMDWILELCDTFKIPSNPREIGLQHSHIEKLAIMAANDPTAAGNPKPVNELDMKALYNNALREEI